MDEGDSDLDVDLDKIRVLSAPNSDRPEGEEEQGGEVEQGGHDEEENSHSGSEAEMSSPERRRLSQQERKRLQSIARYRKKEEPLRTEMKIKEKWVVKREGTETGVRRSSRLLRKYSKK